MEVSMGRKSFVAAFAWALVVFLAVHFVNFPGSVPRFKEVSGGGALLDVSPAFTSDAVYQRMDKYGEEGRRSYAFRNMTVDLLLPISLFPFLYLVMRKATSSLQLHRLLRVTLVSFSFAYVLLDFAENAFVLALLARFPGRIEVLAEILPYVTMAKRMASLLAIFLPLAIFGVRLIGGHSKLGRLISAPVAASRADQVV